MRFLRGSLLLLIAALPLFAQHEHADGAAAPAVALESGLSDLHWAVTTSNAEAQRFFDQGMRFTYAFNHDMAIRSFQRATELDPELAMGYWGAALALGPNINLDVDPDREKQAFATVHTALGHLSTASAKERDLVAALAKRYSDDPGADLHALAADYSRAMGELTKRYPDDLDIATLYAESLMDLRPWKFWSHDGKPAEGTEEIVRVLESVLARNPNHLGANHYYIHAVEASAHPERAVQSAERLHTLAPAAGHLVHMPAHILERTGDYAGAARANEDGARADREFIRVHGAKGVYPLMYYNHNLQFGAAAYAMEGKFAEARKMADEMAANTAPVAKEMTMIESVVSAPVLLSLRFGRWMDVIRTQLPDGAGPLATTMWRFARGVAFARAGNVLGAQSEQKEFERVRATVADDPAIFQNSQLRIAAIAAHVLGGRIAEAGGDRAGAVREYQAAVTLEDALNYDEPSDWFYPIRETLGAALLREERWAEAAQVFEADLNLHPHSPRALWGIAAARRGEKKDAQKFDSEYRRGWKGAPLTLADF